ncbi:ribonuclease Z [Candidatus Bathyarchaeota archaeon]|nr:ribonuclease Z [Candidatus Bathyarchaeota archaeon]
MDIFFLGSGGSIPTKKRNLPCILIKLERELLMLDCGEAAQKQFLSIKAGINKHMKIFISHMHGDHVLGLPGLIQSFSLLGREKKLEIYGPKGIKSFLNCVKKTVPFNLSFKTEVHEIGEGQILEEETYIIKTMWVNHTIPCLSFALIEKPKPGKFNPEKARKLGVPEGPLWKKLQMGESVKIGSKIIKSREVVGPPRLGAKIVYSSDTRPCKAIEKLSKNADLLIFDSTFDDFKKDKASEYGHSTCIQAAKIARKAKVKKLVLTHLSPIYEGCEEKLFEQAKKIFKETILAEDLMKITIKK